VGLSTTTQHPAAPGACSARTLGTQAGQAGGAPWSPAPWRKEQPPTLTEAQHPARERGRTDPPPPAPREQAMPPAQPRVPPRCRRRTGADTVSVLLCQCLPLLVVTMIMFYTRPCSNPHQSPPIKVILERTASQRLGGHVAGRRGAAHQPGHCALAPLGPWGRLGREGGTQRKGFSLD